MKKIISILLVATLLLGLSAFATDVEPVEEITLEELEAPAEEYFESYWTAGDPASKVFLFENFDDYASAEDYVASLADKLSISNFKTARDYAATDALDTVWTENPTASNIKFKENAFGHMGVGMSSGSSWIQFIPEETWNYLQNTDESYVISMDIAADPVGKKTNYSTGHIFMADAYDEENDAPFETITSQTNKWLGHSITGDGAASTNVGMGYANHETGVKSKDIKPGEAYTYAYAFHNAGAGKEDDNYRRIVIDTKLEQSDILINRNKESYAQGMIGKDTIGGFKWMFDYLNGVYISDIKIYTVKDEAGSFYVKMDETVDVPLSSKSVKFKFSQPIAKKAVNASSITMTQNGAPFTYFKVGKVSTYVDETTKEIGSEVELLFPYGLKANATYEIIVNSAVKNEIQKLSIGSNNTVSFTTEAAHANTVSITGEAGLGGSETPVTALEVGKQAKFTGKVETAAEASYILLGVYDSSNNIVSYTYAWVNAGEAISLASKIEASGMKVKAFSAGNLLDLEAFSIDATIQ